MGRRIPAYGDGGWNDERDLALIKGYVVEYDGCAKKIADLALAVAELNLQYGIANSLDAKLDAALNALDDLNDNNDQAACNSLEAFINHVDAQRGYRIPEEDADMLIEEAQRILACIGC